MCLAMPGRVVRWTNRDPIFAQAEVEFGGLRRVCHMACVPDAAPGDYVIAHAGVAISRVDAEAAARTLADLQALVGDGAAESFEADHEVAGLSNCHADDDAGPEADQVATPSSVDDASLDDKRSSVDEPSSIDERSSVDEMESMP